MEFFRPIYFVLRVLTRNQRNSANHTQSQSNCHQFGFPKIYTNFSPLEIPKKGFSHQHKPNKRARKTHTHTHTLYFQSPLLQSSVYYIWIHVCVWWLFLIVTRNVYNQEEQQQQKTTLPKWSRTAGNLSGHNEEEGRNKKKCVQNVSFVKTMKMTTAAKYGIIHENRLSSCHGKCVFYCRGKKNTECLSTLKKSEA